MFCAKCGSQLEQGARFCPACGAAISGAAGSPPRAEPSPLPASAQPQGHPVPPPQARTSGVKTVGRIIVGIVILLFAITFIRNHASSWDQAGADAINKLNSKITATSGDAASNGDASTPTTSEADAIRVSVKELADAYKSNEVTADQRFKGKPLLVTGVVNSVEKDDLNDRIVVYLTADGYDSLSEKAVAQISAEDAAKLQRGQQVTYACKGDGVRVMMEQLVNCVLSVENSNAIAVADAAKEAATASAQIMAKQSSTQGDAATLSSAGSAVIQCSDEQINGKVQEELAKSAISFTRWDEDVVGDLCRGDTKALNDLIRQGNVKVKEVKAIAKVLGKTYRTEGRLTYQAAREKFIGLGMCSACADNFAQYYINKPTDPCGQFAKKALEGEAAVIAKLRDTDECMSYYADESK